MNTKTNFSTDRCYQNLAEAIIEQAIVDLKECSMKKRKLLDEIKILRNKQNKEYNNDKINQYEAMIKNYQSSVKLIETDIKIAKEFFNTAWFKDLSELIGLDGDVLQERIIKKITTLKLA